MKLRLSMRTALSLIAGLVVLDTCQAADPDSVTINPMKTVERDSLRGFLERPLFDPSRRLPPLVTELLPVAVKTTAMPPEPPPPMHLLGVVHGRSDLAVVHYDGQDKTFIIHTGDHVGDWMVTVFPPVSVRLQRGKRAFDYILFGKLTDVSPIAANVTDASQDIR